jgi:hypothetical protein
MADYEISAPNDATMRAALSALGMAQEDGRRGIVRYSVKYYGIKQTWDGTALSAPFPGVYAIVRWVPASVVGNPFPPSGVTLPSGVTINPLPANSPYKFG